MTDKLVICKTARMTTLDCLGGFLWLVISFPLDKDGFPINNRALFERFDTEEWALVCARQRIEEGYRTGVNKTLAFSIADEGKENG